MSHRHATDHNGIARHMHGWRRARHDPRDFRLAEPSGAQITTRPPVLSLRSKMPAVRDQMSLGSCTSNAGVVMAEAVIGKETGILPIHFSRLDLYAITRELEGTPLSEDSGCDVRDVCKALHKWGVCFEPTWPYVIANFSVAPPRKAALEALHHRATSYHQVTSLDGIRQSIVEGYTMIFGFDCFESLMSEQTARTGIITLPQPHEAEVGGHCVTCVGYDDTRRMLEIQNSWGTTWGITGFGWIPYDYVSRGLATDFVTLRREMTR